MTNYIKIEYQCNDYMLIVIMDKFTQYFSQKPLNATLSTLFINFAPFDLESEVAICCGHTIEGLSH